MILEKPAVEFVHLNGSDTISTSGTGGVDSCNGPTSQSRNCTYFNLSMMLDCGYYNAVNKDNTL